MEIDLGFKKWFVTQSYFLYKAGYNGNENVRRIAITVDKNPKGLRGKTCCS